MDEDEAFFFAGTDEFELSSNSVIRPNSGPQMSV